MPIRPALPPTSSALERLKALSAAYPVPNGWQRLEPAIDLAKTDYNPLRGFVPFGMEQADSTRFPHSMVWVSLPLDPIQFWLGPLPPPDGAYGYNWDSVDEALAVVRNNNNQVILHFYVDYPGLPIGTPPFLIEAGVEMRSYTEPANGNPPVSKCPDYNDPRVVLAFIAFLQALAARYDGDPRIAFIVPGLYGFWGEWEVVYHLDWAMSEVNRTALVQTLADSFHKTRIQLRYANSTSNAELMESVGLHDASFCLDTYCDGSAACCAKAKDDWCFLSEVRAAGLDGFWLKHPMGGEMYPGIQDQIFSDPPSGTQPPHHCITFTGASWITMAYLFGEHAPSPGTRAHANALAAHRLMGYQLFVAAVNLLIEPNGRAHLELGIGNSGVAPFYYRWRVELAWADSAGTIVGWTTRVNWQISTIEPGTTSECEASLDVPSGARTLLMRIANPMEGGNPIRFANAEQDSIVDGWLTLATLPQ